MDIVERIKNNFNKGFFWERNADPGAAGGISCMDVQTE